ncbi:MAG: hypothetical protein SFU86_05800 [Pirellulaceae bacterium]|nr:hypothetical protein [Pirellulaceae bacterium]
MPRLATYAAAILLVSRPCYAADEWRETRALPAAEAHQAAAADEKHVYAINNTVVARYDRKTGERLAVSTGEALHLNSGFWREGRLYCAHSNYPRTPEKSELKVLDLATMKLTTAKDFGNYGGSLTWAVWHDERWWCNFARYGGANRETFLARMDGEWREEARWTYPDEVLRKIGQASISGGVWHGGLLTVTDHDHEALYRLRVPAKGEVLEFVREEAAPFAGQGIALDPVTGGLVGIQRSKRLVIFAERK